MRANSGRRRDERGELELDLLLLPATSFDFDSAVLCYFVLLCAITRLVHNTLQGGRGLRQQALRSSGSSESAQPIMDALFPLNTATVVLSGTAMVMATAVRHYIKRDSITSAS